MAKRANPKLVEGCRVWDATSEKAHKGRYPVPNIIDKFRGRGYSFTSPLDYDVLKCVTTGNISELTVGATSGHKATVDMEKGKLDYWDGRSSNNRTMWEILNNEVGLRCKRDSYGVHCKGVTEENVNDVFKAMVMPTSMDFRREYCLEDLGKPTDDCRQADINFFKTLVKGRR